MRRPLGALDLRRPRAAAAGDQGRGEEPDGDAEAEEDARGALLELDDVAKVLAERRLAQELLEGPRKSSQILLRWP